MKKLIMNQLESLTGGDDLTIEEQCMMYHNGDKIAMSICEIELGAGASQSGVNQGLDPLIAGCFAAGIFAMLLGFINPILGRVASVGVTVGCAIAKVESSH